MEMILYDHTYCSFQTSRLQVGASPIQRRLQPGSSLPIRLYLAFLKNTSPYQTLSHGDTGTHAHLASRYRSVADVGAAAAATMKIYK